jgi:hypothetical protein
LIVVPVGGRPQTAIAKAAQRKGLQRIPSGPRTTHRVGPRTDIESTLQLEVDTQVSIVVQTRFFGVDPPQAVICACGNGAVASSNGDFDIDALPSPS